VTFLKKPQPTQTKKVEKAEIVSKITVKKSWEINNLRILAEGDCVTITSKDNYLADCFFDRNLCPQLAEILLQASV